MPRYIIISQHVGDALTWGVVDTLGIEEHREQACEVIASQMTYQTACSMAYLFEHEWTVK